MIRRLTATAAALILGVALAGPANAETRVFYDDRNDVQRGYDDALANWQSGIDIKRTRITLNNDIFQLRSTHIDLTRGNAYDDSWIFLYTTAESARTGIATYTIYNGGYEYTVQRTRTKYQMWHTSPSREVKCASKLNINPAYDTTTFTISRACLGNPWRIRWVHYFTDDRTNDWVYDINGAEGIWTTKN